MVSKQQCNPRTSSFFFVCEEKAKAMEALVCNWEYDLEESYEILCENSVGGSDAEEMCEMENSPMEWFDVLFCFITHCF